MNKITFETLVADSNLEYPYIAAKAFVSQESTHQRIFFYSENSLLTEHVLEAIQHEFKKQKREVTICDMAKNESYAIPEYSTCDILFLLNIDKCSNANALQEIVGNRIESDKNTLITSALPAQFLPFINSGLLCLLKDALVVPMQNITFNLFVYGTLKKGFDNHAYVSHSKFISIAKTAKKYPMITTHPAFPYLIHQAGKGYYIHGEVYAVDYKTLIEVDKLEGYPTHYKRVEIEVILDNGQKIKSWCYFLAEKIDYMRYNLLSNFEQHLRII